jgi:DnaK suppressor protein
METRNGATNAHKPGAKKKASTSDILGSISAPKEISGKWRHQYKSLLDLREHMMHRKNSFAEAAKEEQPVFSLHEADAGTDQYDMDFALSMVSAEQDALYEIEQAITRIRNGSYGVCEMTGVPIELERLDAIPWTRYSAAAQKELEKNGGGSRVKLASRGSFVSGETAEEEDDEEGTE